MEKLNLFIELTRLNKPVGYFLLFWPCAWGLTLSFDFSRHLDIYFLYLFLFISGSVLMRSAGCIVNDIIDRNFDRQVERTKNRPIASGKISILIALLLSSLMCLTSLGILLNFNFFTIILALCSVPFAFTYPLMKRYTYWPQLFLGITFNYGLILGWTSINQEISLIPILFYIGAIFWTLGYDTIYGYQDIKDDEIIGVKSTSIKFKNNPKKFIFSCYSVFFILLILTGYMMSFGYTYYVLSILVFIHLFLFQLKMINIDKPEDCLKKFKSNNFLGLIVYLAILSGKLF